MTTTVTNRGKKMIVNGDIMSATFYMGLLGGGSVPVGAHDETLNTVADLLAIATETSGGGYTRQVITGITVTENDVDNRADVDSDDVEFGNLTSDAGIGRGMFIYKSGGSDAIRELFMVADVAATPFNGNPVKMLVHDIFRLVQN